MQHIKADYKLTSFRLKLAPFPYRVLKPHQLHWSYAHFFSQVDAVLVTLDSLKPSYPVQMSQSGLKPPKDLWHHLSESTKARNASHVKQFYKYFRIPGIAQLAGGMRPSERVCYT